MDTRRRESLSKLMKKWLLGSFVMVLAFPVFADSASLPDGLIVSVAPINQEYAPADQVLVKVVYKNVSSGPLRVLLWDTVLEGRVDVDFVDLVSDVGRLPYNGRHYKRAAPTENDYLIIASGQELDVIVDLRSGYQIDYAGEYSLSVRRGYSESVSSIETQSRTFSLSADRAINFKQTPIVQNCIASRQSELDLSLAAAERIALIARNDLRNTPVDQRAQAQRYIEWFGVYSEARWNIVQDHFNRIASAASGKVITFICDDTSSAFAYVYPNRPYDIYLGQAFWRAPRTGTDSKAGTIVHELSHFDVLGGTDDVVYGQSGARSLARTNPNRAVQNADSHEYFAENTPFLSMPKGENSGGSGATSVAMTIDSVASSKSAPVVNSTFSVSARVLNPNDFDLNSIVVTVRLSEDSAVTSADALIGELSFGTLASRKEATVAIESSSPGNEGEYFVGVCATATSSEGQVNVCSAGLKVDVNAPLIVPIITDLLLNQ